MADWCQGKTEAASTLAGIFSEHVDSKLKFFTQTSKNVGAVCNHAHENTSLNAFRAKHTKDSPPGSSSQTISTSVQSSQDTTEGQCAESVNIVTLSQAELEEMLAARTASPATRGQAYLRLLEIFRGGGPGHSAGRETEDGRQSPPPRVSQHVWQLEYAVSSRRIDPNNRALRTLGPRKTKS